MCVFTPHRPVCLAVRGYKKKNIQHSSSYFQEIGQTQGGIISLTNVLSIEGRQVKAKTKPREKPHWVRVQLG